MTDSLTVPTWKKTPPEREAIARITDELNGSNDEGSRENYARAARAFHDAKATAPIQRTAHGHEAAARVELGLPPRTLTLSADTDILVQEHNIVATSSDWWDMDNAPALFTAPHTILDNPDAMKAIRDAFAAGVELGELHGADTIRRDLREMLGVRQ